MDFRKYDCIIIGGGPCGVAAALYIKQAGYEVAIIEKDIIGGAPRYTTTLNNVAGFIGTGEEFANNLEQQVADNNIDVIYDKVNEVAYNSKNELYVFNKHKICSSTLVIATGSCPMKMEKLQGYSNVHYCSLCDGPLYKDKSVVVFGGGNSAFTEAINLSKICKEVTLLALKQYGFTATKALQEKAKLISNIKLDVYEDFRYLKGCSWLEYWQFDNRVDHKIDVDGIFVSIGRSPNVVETRRASPEYDGYHVTSTYNVLHKRKLSSLFAGGDVITKPIKQISTAINDGVEISRQVINYLNSMGG